MSEGCDSEFDTVTAATFLPESSIALLQKIKQEKEIDLAELEGLEKCPFVFLSASLESRPIVSHAGQFQILSLRLRYRKSF